MRGSGEEVEEERGGGVRKDVEGKVWGRGGGGRVCKRNDVVEQQKRGNEQGQGVEKKGCRRGDGGKTEDGGRR